MARLCCRPIGDGLVGAKRLEASAIAVAVSSAVYVQRALEAAAKELEEKSLR